MREKKAQLIIEEYTIPATLAWFASTSKNIQNHC